MENSDPRCKCKPFSLFSLLCLPPLEALLSIAVHTKALTPPHDTEGMGRKGGGGEVKMIFIVRSPLPPIYSITGYNLRAVFDTKCLYT
jgi:hypothetical protein